ncbi:hypothetical protein Pelo_5611 [Pelomyxa schiedti]|nr:hypothetical protein Pelo_5611 [Pelomyxa schiedti]
MRVSFQPKGKSGANYATPTNTKPRATSLTGPLVERLSRALASAPSTRGGTHLLDLFQQVTTRVDGIPGFIKSKATVAAPIKYIATRMSTIVEKVETGMPEDVLKVYAMEMFYIVDALASGLPCTDTKLAAITGNAALVRMKVEANKTEIESSDAKQNSLLHLTCLSENAELLGYLMEKAQGIIFTENRDGYNLVHLVSLIGSTKCLEVLLKFMGPNAFTSEDKHGRTPVQHMISGSRSLPCLSTLLAAAPALFSTEIAASPLHYAIKAHCSSDLLQVFIESPIIDLNVNSPLRYAVITKNLVAIEALTNSTRVSDKEKNLTLQYISSEMKTLKWAHSLLQVSEEMQKYYYNVFGVLLRAGVNPSSSLHDIVETDNVDMLKFVVSSARVIEDLPNASGKMLAHYIRSVEAGEVLLKVGVNINAISSEGNTPLMESIIVGNRTVAEWLLQIPGIDLNHINQDGKSALTCTLRKSNQDIDNELLFKLLSCGADPLPILFFVVSIDDIKLLKLISSIHKTVGEVRDSDNETPLHKALSPEAVEVLCLIGAQVNAKSKKNETPLMRSIMNNKTPVSLALLSNPSVQLGNTDILGRNELYLSLRLQDTTVALKVLDMIVSGETERGVGPQLLTAVSGSGWTALHLAFRHGTVVTRIATELEAKIDWNIPSTKYSLVHLAAHHKDPSILKMLVGKGLNTQQRTPDKKEFTAHEVALYHVPQFTECANYLASTCGVLERATAQVEQILPNACLEVIFSFLDIVDLNSCALTCKQWYDVSLQAKQYSKVALKYGDNEASMIRNWRLAAIAVGNQWEAWLKIMRPGEGVWCAVIKRNIDTVVACDPLEWLQPLQENIAVINGLWENSLPVVFNIGEMSFMAHMPPSLHLICQGKAGLMDILRLKHVILIWYRPPTTLWMDISAHVRYFRDYYMYAESARGCCDMWGELLHECGWWS